MIACGTLLTKCILTYHRAALLIGGAWIFCGHYANSNLKVIQQNYTLAYLPLPINNSMMKSNQISEQLIFLRHRHKTCNAILFKSILRFIRPSFGCKKGE